MTEIVEGILIYKDAVYIPKFILDHVVKRNKMYCSNCGITGKMLRCNGCHVVHYCSKECQKNNYKEHKVHCLKNHIVNEQVKYKNLKQIFYNKMLAHFFVLEIMLQKGFKKKFGNKKFWCFCENETNDGFVFKLMENKNRLYNIEKYDLENQKFKGFFFNSETQISITV